MKPTGEADVIIVGSGPAGISAAWPLVGAGVRVLMLDAGTAPLPPSPTHATLAEWRADPIRWEAELGTRGPLAETGLSPKFATPLARATLAGFAATAGLDAAGYVAVGSLAAGGLSRIWGALAARYSAADLAGFPEGADIEASYAHVSRRIGTSGGGDLADVDLAAFTPPVAHFVAGHRGVPAQSGFSLVTAPNAVLGERREERLGCTACGLCLHGCARGSIYHSAMELPALRRHRNFTYHGGVRVERLAGAPGMQVVEARIGMEPVRFRAPIVILAAGTLATTSLALRRLDLTGVPVRLLSNPVGGMAFVVPHLVGRSLPKRSFGLGQLFYTLQPEPGVEAAGVVYGADTLPLGAVADRLPFTRPVALRTARALAPALLLATSYLPGRFSNNRLTVEDDGAFGRIRIDGCQTVQAEQLLRGAFADLRRRARTRGAWGVPGSLQILPPGADAHPAGTLPMNGTGPAATLADGALAGAPGVFVADGAALPLLSARHPTLTIMANADRIGRSLAKRFAMTPSIAYAG